MSETQWELFRQALVAMTELFGNVRERDEVMPGDVRDAVEDLRTELGRW